MKRFFDKIEKTDSCWNWVGAKTSGGYGNIGINNKTVRAHRLSYELHNGPFDPKLFVCHKCDNPGCVNPEHLFLGNNSDNMKDCFIKGRLKIPLGMRARKILHPSMSSYTNGCRCDECKSICRKYHKERYKMKKF